MLKTGELQDIPCLQLNVLADNILTACQPSLVLHASLACLTFSRGSRVLPQQIAQPGTISEASLPRRKKRRRSRHYCWLFCGVVVVVFVDVGKLTVARLVKDGIEHEPAYRSVE